VYISLSTQSENFWLLPHTTFSSKFHWNPSTISVDKTHWGTEEHDIIITRSTSFNLFKERDPRTESFLRVLSLKETCVCLTTPHLLFTCSSSYRIVGVLYTHLDTKHSTAHSHIRDNDWKLLKTLSVTLALNCTWSAVEQKVEHFFPSSLIIESNSLATLDVHNSRLLNAVFENYG
jgi:hypothetical protein